jgi:hypothetical protein
MVRASMHICTRGYCSPQSRILTIVFNLAVLRDNTFTSPATAAYRRSNAHKEIATDQFFYRTASCIVGLESEPGIHDDGSNQRFEIREHNN